MQSYDQHDGADDVPPRRPTLGALRNKSAAPTPHLGALSPTCPCWECAVNRGADRALAENAVVEVGDLVLVPDVVIAEHVANGAADVDTWRLVRGDGRSVSVFRVEPAR